MAHGGWLRNTFQVGPYAGESDATLQAAVDLLVNGLASFTNWSVKKASTKHYTTTRGYHAVLQHTGGAELAIVWIGTNTSTSTAAWHPINHREAVSPTLSMDQVLMMAYIPPGKGAFDSAKAPGNTDWITGNGLTEGFLLNLVADYDYSSSLHQMFSGGYHQFTWQVRGDDVLFVAQVNKQTSPTSEHIRFWGTGIDTIRVGDTERELYAAYGINSPYAPIWSETPKVDFHNEDGDQVLKGITRVPTNFLSSTYTTGPPYNAVKLELMNDLAEGAVSSDGKDGYKGEVSNEVLFLTPTGPTNKDTWNSGTHVHIQGGVWIGSDVSNGAWP